MRDISNLHTFVICAYKECDYLEELIESLENQTYKSTIIMETSTPNDFIFNMGKKHNIPVYVNEGEGGITQDWNYGYAQTTTEYVTIAHQDDKYAPDYSKCMIEAMEKAEHPLIYFTNYAEIRNGEVVENNKILRIKRMLLRPLEDFKHAKSIWWRRRVLSMGDPVLCPSITFAKSNCPKVVFNNHFLACEDWETLEMLSKLDGEFLYDKQILSYHRIHAESTTTLAFSMNKRAVEDYEMFCKFWPKPIAKFLLFFYKDSQKSNEV